MSRRGLERDTIPLWVQLYVSLGFLIVNCCLQTITMTQTNNNNEKATEIWIVISIIWVMALLCKKKMKKSWFITNARKSWQLYASMCWSNKDKAIIPTNGETQHCVINYFRRTHLSPSQHQSKTFTRMVIKKKHLQIVTQECAIVCKGQRKL